MTMALWALVGVVVIGMLLRMPIGFSMLMAGVAYLLVKGQDLGLVAEQVSNGLYNSYVLLAVPLFVFAANIMNAGTVSERIFDFCRILVGRMRGGLAQVDILVSVIFSGMSGADLQLNGWSGVLRQLHGVLFARIFINHVVAHQAVFHEVLGDAAGLVLHLSTGVLKPVTHDGAAHHPDHGGQSLACAATDLAAHCTASDGAHQGARARSGVLHCHRGLAASLARYGHLLVNGGA